MNAIKNIIRRNIVILTILFISGFVFAGFALSDTNLNHKFTETLIALAIWATAMILLEIFRKQKNLPEDML